MENNTKPAIPSPDDEIKYADITRARIAYKTFGTGDPLLLCMGFASNMDLWSNKLIQVLQTKFMVIVFDYRGMGFSTSTEGFSKMSTLGEDIHELLGALGIRKTHILGWSMGGYVAQMFAINHPDEVSRLVLYATNCGDTVTVNPSQEIIKILSNPGSSPMALLGTLFPDDLLSSHPEPWKFLPQPTEPVNPEAIGSQYFAIQEWLKPDGGSAGRLNALTMPVLIITGEKDKVVPVTNASMLAGEIPSSSLIVVQGSGHGLMYQLPEIFANHVLSFLCEG
jgi:pimeloyl-ACP methyl ester carboxylesterase